jgi:hypothetical protein
MNKHLIDSKNLDHLKDLAIKYINLEHDIIEKVIDIEAKHDPDDETDYMDEGEQTEHSLLYTFLDRELNEFEQNRIKELRKVYLGYEEPTTIDEAEEQWANNLGTQWKGEIDSNVLKDVRIQTIKEIQ